MVDLGYQGSQFMWTNSRAGRFKVMERLDCVWASVAWHRMFEHAEVHHLTRSHSDHHPILLKLVSELPVTIGSNNFFSSLLG